jgi:hypothetical protein
MPMVIPLAPPPTAFCTKAVEAHRLSLVPGGAVGQMKFCADAGRAPNSNVAIAAA